MDTSWILGDAQWLAHRYDPVADAFQFRYAPREAQSRALFLTDAYLPATREDRPIRRADVAAARIVGAPLHYIFHSAFCGSTLLARALDRPGLAMTLKEPVLLNDLVGWRRRGAGNEEVGAVLETSIRLMSRTFRPEEAVVVKPSNIVASFQNALMTMRPDTRALILYTPLRTYLGSIVRKGLMGRLWVRDLFIGLLRDGLVDLGLDVSEHITLTDLQIAAVGWLAQHALFARLLGHFGPRRMRSLQSDRLFADPAMTLQSLFPLFGWSEREDVIPDILASHIFDRHSKSDQPFTASERAIERRTEDAHTDEIEKVTIWARMVAGHAGVAMELPHPLQP